MKHPFDNPIDCTPDLVHCPYKRCHEFGEYIYCYFDIYSNCEKYQRWITAIELYKQKALKHDFLRRKGFKFKDLENI